MHGDYWDGAVMDVPHKSAGKGVCTGSVTYMLDGSVGLMADLSVMAQIAALARDVSLVESLTFKLKLTIILCQRNKTFFVDDSNWNRGK